MKVRIVHGVLAAAAALALNMPPASAESYVLISGAGSSWSAPAISQWASDVSQYGMRINYESTGSSAGRTAFIQGTQDFAASDIPFQFTPEDGSEPDKITRGTYAYIPVTAGGTSLMYNLTISGQRVTNLRLSDVTVAKIFTSAVTSWDDPVIAADNPGLTLPAKKIVPVVRSDGSGSSFQFTRWLHERHRGIWEDFCRRAGRSSCGPTSFYPTVGGSGMVAYKGDDGVAVYVAQKYADGAIGYVNYSYPFEAGFPVAKMLNAAGYFTEPTPNNVAVSLLKAKINTDASSDDYLTQQLDEVYTNPDPRAYVLSSYSYMILPTKVRDSFNEAKGKTLSAFAFYAMCEGQQGSAGLGYSPMPINLVQASFDQIRKIPGAVQNDITIQDCKNPTFSPDGHNVLADKAPQPRDCDKQGPTQCATGTGGAAKTSTPVKSSAAGPGASGAGASAAGAARNTGAAQRGSTASRAGDRSTNPTTVDGQAVDGVTDDTFDSAGEDSGEIAVGAPITLASDSGWSESQTLIAVALILTLLLVFAPGIAARLLAGKRSS